MLLSSVKIQGNSKHVIVFPHLGQISLKILHRNNDCIHLVTSLNPYRGIKIHVVKFILVEVEVIGW